MTMCHVRCLYEVSANLAKVNEHRLIDFFYEVIC